MSSEPLQPNIPPIKKRNGLEGAFPIVQSFGPTRSPVEEVKITRIFKGKPPIAELESAKEGVEVAPLVDGNVALRDGKKQDGPVLVFTPEEWIAFTAGVRDGEFDLAVLVEPSRDILTVRQTTVLNLKAQGYSQEEISMYLGLSPVIIKKESTKINKLYGTDNMGASVMKAIHYDLINLKPFDDKDDVESTKERMSSLTAKQRSVFDKLVDGHQPEFKEVDESVSEQDVNQPDSQNETAEAFVYPYDHTRAVRKKLGGKNLIHTMVLYHLGRQAERVSSTDVDNAIHGLKGDLKRAAQNTSDNTSTTM